MTGRVRGWVVAAAVAVGLATAAGAAGADTRRVAVVVGHNAGSGSRPPLRFAETDAGKMARVLVELGGVSPGDLFLLQGRSLHEVEAAFAAVRRRITSYGADPARRVVLIFYFSGHSDGHALELARERLSFPELRRWLVATGADVRVALVDSCNSGGLIQAKGGSPAPPFQIRLTDDLASRGEAFLTSSAADEISLESQEIGGSFFTHHLVSGLRGAADASGDGRVTLSEAYQYAHARTLAATSDTTVGLQHPNYDYRLSGQGELLVTELRLLSAAIELPHGFERALVIDLLHDQIIAELRSGDRPFVAVQAGQYAVRLWRGGAVFSRRFTLGRGERQRVAWRELDAAVQRTAHAKGGAAPAAGWSPVAAVGFGARDGGAAEALGVAGSLRVGVRTDRSTGPSLAIVGSTGEERASAESAAFRESAAWALVGYHVGLDRGRLSLSVGLEVGGGLVVQSTRNASARSPAWGGAPVVGLALQIAARFDLAVEGHLLVSALRRDGETVVVRQPAAWVGLRFRL